MIYRTAFLVTLAFALASCTSTDFQAWEGGNSVIQGHGGTRKVVDGMDVWTHGDVITLPAASQNADHDIM